MRKRRNIIELKEREKMYKRREKWKNVWKEMYRRKEKERKCIKEKKKKENVWKERETD